MILFCDILQAGQMSARFQNLRSLWHLNENNGSVTRDEINLSSGELENGPVWVNGKFGAGIEFVDSNDRITFGNESNFDFSIINDTWSVVLWYKSVLRPDGFMIGKANDFSSDGTWIIMGNNITEGDIGVYLRNNTSGAARRQSTAVLSPSISANNTFHNLIVVIRGVGSRVVANSDFRIYLDGINQAVTEASGVGLAANDEILNNRQLRLGLPPGGGSNNFTGIIDEVAIFDREITAGEARTIYNNGIGRRTRIEQPEVMQGAPRIEREDD